MTTITCPYCWTEIEIYDDLEGCQLKDEQITMSIGCDCCEKQLDIELDVEVVGATCITKNDEPTAEEFELMRADELIDLQRDREMGIE